MEFDQSLMKQAAAFQAMSQPAQQASSPSQAESGQLSSTLKLTQPSHASHMPSQRSSSRTGNHRQTLPAPPQLSNGLSQPASGAAPLRMTRGNKRARSPSSEQLSHPQISPRAQPGALSPQEVSHRIQIQKQALPQPRWPQHAQHAQQQQQPQQLQQVRQQARLQQQLQHAQQLQHQQLQQQQHQQQHMPDCLPPGAVPIGLHQAGFQPLHANLSPQMPAIPPRTAPTSPCQTYLASSPRQQQQKPEKLIQKSPQQLPMRPMPIQQRASQPEQGTAKSPGAMPDSVDGMSKEEIIAAAAAAAAASGYCEPKGLASLVSRSAQVCL